MKLGAEAFGSHAHVLTVDHGLRAEAGAECALVAGLAAELGLPHQTLRLSLSGGGNVQARAREARYAAMADWCSRRAIPLLLTAHHADDQAETLLLRLARGSGIGGLAGIRERRDLGGVLLLRPLLRWRRANLAAVVKSAGWTPVDDPSNRDTGYDRTHARALLAETAWIDVDRLSASAAHLAQAEAALDWAAGRAFASRVSRPDGRLVVNPEGLPAELRRRLLAAALAEFGADPDGPTLQRLLALLGEGKSGTVATVRVQATPPGLWTLGSAPPRAGN
jgi:tRNA(Ile)-lysidine synthase